MKRLWLVLVVILSTSIAWAGSYLDRAALLVNEAHRSGAFLRQRPSDRELARVVQKTAEARLEAAQTMIVPKEVVLAHPHVLIVLEHHERAAAAAADGDLQRCLMHELKADEEERVLRSVLEQLGWPLPKP
ncbi:MAG: hypothetical protein QM784_33995 [Polyangiaceae bacterium]